MGARHLLQSFDAWRAAAEPLALATVYETAGSTYSKAGQRILLAANGDYRASSAAAASRAISQNVRAA